MSYNKCPQHKTIMYLLLSKTFNIPFVEKETAINYSLGHCNSFLFFFLFFLVPPINSSLNIPGYLAEGRNLHAENFSCFLGLSNWVSKFKKKIIIIILILPYFTVYSQSLATKTVSFNISIGYICLGVNISGLLTESISLSSACIAFKSHFHFWICFFL